MNTSNTSGVEHLRFFGNIAMCLGEIGNILKIVFNVVQQIAFSWCVIDSKTN